MQAYQQKTEKFFGSKEKSLVGSTPGGLDIQTQNNRDSLKEQILSKIQGSWYPNRGVSI